MVSTPEIFIDNSSILPGPPMIVKKCSAIKPLRLFTEGLYVKNKTAVRRLVVSKSNLKALIEDSMLCSSIPKRKVRRKINEQVKKYLYNLFCNILRLCSL